jgi:hypothetical protein
LLESKPSLIISAQPSAEIVVTESGQPIARGVSDTNGIAVATPVQPLSEGDHQLRVVERKDGRTTYGATIAAQVMSRGPRTVGRVDQGVLLFVGPRDHATISGVCDPWAVVTISKSNAVLSATRANRTGRYSLALPAFAEGFDELSLICANELGVRSQETVGILVSSTDGNSSRPAEKPEVFSPGEDDFRRSADCRLCEVLEIARVPLAELGETIFSAKLRDPTGSEMLKTLDVHGAATSERDKLIENAMIAKARRGAMTPELFEAYRQGDPSGRIEVVAIPRRHSFSSIDKPHYLEDAAFRSQIDFEIASDDGSSRDSIGRLLSSIGATLIADDGYTLRIVVSRAMLRSLSDHPFLRTLDIPRASPMPAGESFYGTMEYSFLDAPILPGIPVATGAGVKVLVWDQACVSTRTCKNGAIHCATDLFLTQDFNCNVYPGSAGDANHPRLVLSLLHRLATGSTGNELYIPGTAHGSQLYLDSCWGLCGNNVIPQVNPAIVVNVLAFGNQIYDPSQDCLLCHNLRSYGLETPDMRNMDVLALRPPYPLFISAAGNYQKVDNHTQNGLVVGASDDRGTPDQYDDTMVGVPYTAFINRYSPHGDIEDPQFVAPGTNVRTIDADNSGTSFSAPIAAGAAARMPQANPSLFSWPEAMRAILMASSMPVPGDGRPLTLGMDSMDGTGQLDALIAVQNSKQSLNYSNQVGYPSNGFSYGTILFGAGGCPEGAICRSYNVSIQANRWFTAVVTWDADENASADCTFCDEMCEEGAPKIDLDMTLTNSSGVVRTSSTSFDNTFEVIQTNSLPAGNYTLQVRRFARGWSCGSSTWFGVAWSNLPITRAP